MLGDDFATKDALNIVFCGTGSPIYHPDRASTCIAIEAAGKLFLLDTGPGGYARARQYNLPFQKITGILFSHYHSDHIGDLGQIATQSWLMGRKHALDIYGGPGIESIAHGVNTLYSEDRKYRMAHHGAEYLPAEGGLVNPIKVKLNGHGDVKTIYDQDGLRVQAFQVDHSPVEPALGFRIDYKDRSVIFSGDCSKDMNMVKMGKGCDIMFHEALAADMIKNMCGVFHSKGYKREADMLNDIFDYHTTPVEAAELAEEADVPLLVLYHLIPTNSGRLFERMLLRGVSNVRKKGVLISWDGLHISLPIGSKEVKKKDLN